MARDVADLNGQDEARTASARVRADELERISPRAIELDDPNETQFLRTEKRIPVRRNALDKKTQGLLKRAIAVSAVVLITGSFALAAYHYGVNSWRFRLDSSENVAINGIHNVSRAQVMDVIGSDIGRNIFFVPLDARKNQLEQIPWVESATVMRLLPNRLGIEIHERTPVAFTRTGSKINLIDATGVVLPLAPHHQAKYSFPVIEGIGESEPLSSRAAAMRIYSRLVRELDAEDPHYAQDLSEVDLSDPEDIKVTANGAAGGVVVHLGNSDFLTRYRLYKTHISEWRQQFQNLQSVDLRYEGQIVVNPDANQAAEYSPQVHAVTIRQAMTRNQKPPRKRK